MATNNGSMETTKAICEFVWCWNNFKLVVCFAYASVMATKITNTYV
jgi:hypothetical protein